MGRVCCLSTWITRAACPLFAWAPIDGRRSRKATKPDETVTSMFRNFLGSELPGAEIVHDANFGEHRSYNELVDIVPANLDLDDTEIDLTSSHQGNAIQSEWNKRTLTCRWLEETELDEEYDYIVFDCAPATKIVSQNAIAASHGYIVPIVPEAVMERGAPHLHNMIRSGIDQKLQALARMGEGRTMFVSDTKLIGLVVTRIQIAGHSQSGYTNDHTQHLRSLKRLWDKHLVEPYIKQGAGVGEAMTDRVPVYDRPDTQNVGGRGIHQQFKELTETLKARMGRIVGPSDSMEATKDSAKHMQDLLIGDIVKYLTRLAAVQQDERTGNASVSEGLRLLVECLQPHKSRPVGDLASLHLGQKTLRVRETRKPPIELPDALESLDWDQVNAILENEQYQKKQIIELGESRFGIPRSRMSRLKRADAIASIRAALDHERSLSAIEHRARVAGERRTA